MADNKGSEQKEGHLQRKTKHCQPQKTNTEEEKAFQISAWKLY